MSTKRSHTVYGVDKKSLFPPAVTVSAGPQTLYAFYRLLSYNYLTFRLKGKSMDMPNPVSARVFITYGLGMAGDRIGPPVGMFCLRKGQRDEACQKWLVYQREPVSSLPSSPIPLWSRAWERISSAHPANPEDAFRQMQKLRGIPSVSLPMGMDTYQESIYSSAGINSE